MNYEDINREIKNICYLMKENQIYKLGDQTWIQIDNCYRSNNWNLLNHLEEFKRIGNEIILYWEGIERSRLKFDSQDLAFAAFAFALAFAFTFPFAFPFAFQVGDLKDLNGRPLKSSTGHQLDLPETISNNHLLIE